MLPTDRQTDRQTDDRRQTDGRATAYSEREREFTFAKKAITADGFRYLLLLSFVDEQNNDVTMTIMSSCDLFSGCIISQISFTASRPRGLCLASNNTVRTIRLTSF